MKVEVLSRSDQASTFFWVAACPLELDIKGREIALQQVDVDYFPVGYQFLDFDYLANLFHVLLQDAQIRSDEGPRKPELHKLLEQLKDDLGTHF